jgi:glycosyltransferase involved in cell wall biosynthesis
VSARRIALVIGQLTRGGAEGQLAQVARQLDRERFEPLVYCLSGQTEPVGSEMSACGVPVRVCSGSAPGRVRQLVRHLETDRIDLVHSWLYLANAAAGAAHLLQRSRPLITSARNCKLQGRINWVSNILAFRLSRAIVVNSREVAAFITRLYKAPADRIRVIYNGVDTVRFHPQPSNDDALGPIITVGRLVEQKHHSLFLNAAAQLAMDLDVRFVIVGDGPLRPALAAQASRLGIADRVCFAGERRDIEDMLRTASLFWLTSRWEGLPNVVLEAMACGVPVIATDVGGTRELLRSGVEGFILPSADATALARQSHALLVDAAQRRRLALAARARAAEFSNARMVGRLVELFEEVLNAGQ